VSSTSNLRQPVFDLLTEPELCRCYYPKKAFNQEIELIHDLEPIEVAQSKAGKFKYEHGDQWFIKFKKGARVLVPKAFALSLVKSPRDRTLAAMVFYL
jgi:hypothetical protein